MHRSKVLAIVGLIGALVSPTKPYANSVKATAFDVIDGQYNGESVSPNDADNRLHSQKREQLIELMLARGLNNVEVNVIIMPLARARYTVTNEQWCLSFVPPVDKTNVIFQPIGNTLNKIGLYRTRQEAAFKWQRLGELSGKKVATARDNSQSVINAMLTENGLLPVYVTTFEQGLMLVARGRVDFAVGNDHLLQTSPQLEKVASELQFSDTTLIEYPTYVFVNRHCSIAKQLDGTPP